MTAPIRHRVELDAMRELHFSPPADPTPLSVLFRDSPFVSLGFVEQKISSVGGWSESP